MEYVNIHEFPNGLSLVHHRHDSPISHCGFVMDVGSRDEEANEMGMAHFIEHMFFKGTRRRKTIHILNRLEFVGGEMNAYTTKDKTAVYASLGDVYFPRALDLLCDVVFNSNFPAAEIEKEKKVVHEEVDMYLDSPEENILDLFQEKAFSKNSLGYNILGTHETLSSFSHTSIQKFYHQWYTPHRLAFVYNGPRSFEQVIRLCTRHFEQFHRKDQGNKRKLYTSKAYTPFSEELDKGHVQSYLVLGGLSYSSGDLRRAHASLLMNILGGPGLNSKLSLVIREKHAFAYDVEASYMAMQDIGIFNIYVGTDQKHIRKTQDLILKELNKLKTRKLTDLQLKRYKMQLKGQIMMAEENRVNLALLTGKLHLENRPIETLDQLFKRLEAITASELMDSANEMFDSSNISTLIFKGETKGELPS